MRSNESTWMKTGSGLMTRAVASYIARTVKLGETPDIVILSPEQIVPHITMTNPAPHKRSTQHWSATGVSTADPLKRLFAEQLAMGRGGAVSGSSGDVISNGRF